MKLSQFKFRLPEDLIALEPTFHRDECRLMVVHRKSGKIELTKKDENGEDLLDEEGNPVYLDFRNILDYFDEDDTFIFNDSKVFPARLYGTKEKTDAKIEVFLLRELNRDLRLWDVLVEPARKIRIGNKLFFEDDGPMVAEVIDNTTSRGRTLRFLFDGSYEDFKEALFSLGEPYVPEWVKEKVTPEDFENYRILVRSLKSKALYIGAVEISSIAKTLEYACNEGDYDFVRSRHGELMQKYRQLMQIFKELF